MANVMPNVYAMLTEDSSILANVAERIYLTRAPQRVEEPYIVWTVVSDVPVDALTDIPDLDSVRVQVDVFARDVVVAREIAFLVRDVLQEVGHIQNGPVDTTQEKTQLDHWSLDVLIMHYR